MPYSVPLEMAQNISPSVLALCQPISSVSVKSLGCLSNDFANGPFPLPSSPWQLAQTPFPWKIALPVEMAFSLMGPGLFKDFTAANLSAGTLGLNASSPAEYAGVILT